MAPVDHYARGVIFQRREEDLGYNNYVQIFAGVLWSDQPADRDFIVAVSAAAQVAAQAAWQLAHELRQRHSTLRILSRVTADFVIMKPTRLGDIVELHWWAGYAPVITRVVNDPNWFSVDG